MGYFLTVVNALLWAARR